MSKPAWAIGARTGPVRSFKDLKVFACEGLICIVDEREGQNDEFVVILPSEAVERAKALNEKYRGRTRAQYPQWQRTEMDRVRNGSENALECVREAKHMGDPSDPRVRAFWTRHRRSSSIVVKFSPGADPAGYPKLPPLPRGKVTGKTVAADKQMTPGDLAGGIVIHQRPRKKQRPGLINL